MQSVTRLAKGSSVSVIGGGISGLSFAYFLGKLRPDLNIKLYEKSDRVGGYINTAMASEQTKLNTSVNTPRGLKMEKGPRTLRGVSPGTLIIVDLLYKMGKLDQLYGVHMGSDGNKKYLLKEPASSNHDQIGQVVGDLMEVPGPGCKSDVMLKFLGSRFGTILIGGLIKDLFYSKKSNPKNYGNDSIEDFMTRHFGHKMINEIGSALMYGIYATDVSQLGSQCVMKGMVDMEKEGGSIIRTSLKRMRAAEKKNTIDENVKLYLDNIGSDLNFQHLSQLLKKFPMLALKDGLSILCTGLRESMPVNVKIVFNEGIAKLEKAGEKMVMVTNKGEQNITDYIRSTVGTHVLSALIDDTESKKVLDQFEYTNVAVCNILIPSKDVKKYKGFGFLIPKAHFNEETRLMGVIFDSDVEENSRKLFGSVPEVLKSGVVGDEAKLKEALADLESQIVAGRGVPEEDFTKLTLMINMNKNKAGVYPTLTDSKVKMIATEMFKNILGAQSVPSMAIEVTHLEKCIPIYDTKGPGFLERRRHAQKTVSHNYNHRLSLGGMSFAAGVGVPDVVVSSLKDVLEIV